MVGRKEQMHVLFYPALEKDAHHEVNQHFLEAKCDFTQGKTPHGCDAQRGAGLDPALASCSPPWGMGALHVSALLLLLRHVF